MAKSPENRLRDGEMPALWWTACYRFEVRRLTDDTWLPQRRCATLRGCHLKARVGDRIYFRDKNERWVLLRVVRSTEASQNGNDAPAN